MRRVWPSHSRFPVPGTGSQLLVVQDQCARMGRLFVKGFLQNCYGHAQCSSGDFKLSLSLAAQDDVEAIR